MGLLMTRYGGVLLTCSALLCAVGSTGAWAADLAEGVLDDGRGVIRFSGVVEPGDYENFKKLYDSMAGSSNRAAAVLLDSPGGDVTNGVLIGTFIHDQKMETIVEKGRNCFSSCISIFAAGVPRTASSGARMGVHRAYDDQAANKDNAQARSVSIFLNDYYRKFNVPDQIRIAMIDTPPDKVYVLSERELRAFSTSNVKTEVSRPVLTVEKSRKLVEDTKLKALELMDGGKFMEAAQSLEKIKDRGASDYEVFSMLGRAYYMSGNRTQALINYTAAVKINPHHPDSWRCLGELQADDGNVEWATQSLVKYYINMDDKELAFSVLEGMSARYKGQKRDLAAAAARRKVRK